MSEDKKILDKIRSIFMSEEAEEKKVELATMTLDDGVTMIEAEVFEPGNEVVIVQDEQRIPLPVGEYMMNDGSMLVVEGDGIIAAYGMPQEEEVVEEEEVAMADKPNESPVDKKVIESVTKETQFKALEEENEKLKTELSALKEELEEMKKDSENKEENAVELKEIKHNPEKKEAQKVDLSALSSKGRLVEFLNNRK